jgi:hypothetical protein
MRSGAMIGANVEDAWKPDEGKLAELIVYVAGKIRGDPTGGATKINKILFYSDFAAVRSQGFPITGVEYQKLDNGPAPRRLVPIRQQLIDEGAVDRVEDEYFGKTVHRLVPLREANTKVFKDSELRIVDQVVEALWGLTAAQVSERSHEDKGWQMVDVGETIPYSSAFLSPRFRPTEAKRKHAAELSRRLAEAG